MMLYNYQKKIGPNHMVNIKYESRPLATKVSNSKRSHSQNLANIVTSKITNRSSNVKTIYQKQGLNDQVLQRRRENHLNTHYNKRKNYLKDVTKENKKIYQRINSQKSFYSNKSLNKSYQSNVSISRRISKSKLTNRSSKQVHSGDQTSEVSSKFGSRVSKRSSVPNKNKPESSNKFTGQNSKKQPIVKVQYQNINNLTQDNIKDFKSLFMRTKSTKTNCAANFNSQQNIPINKNITIRKKQMSFRPLPFQDGFLHKIAEEMYSQKTKPSQGQIAKKRQLF